MTKKQEEKNKRVVATIHAFLKMNGDVSDKELANILVKCGIKTSHSTVDRDLSTNLLKMFKDSNKEKKVDSHLINDNGLTDEQTSIYAYIIKKRKDNKRNGQIKGGNSVKKRGEIDD